MKSLTRWRDYWPKWRGARAGGPPRVRSDEIFWSWVGTVCGIGLLTIVGTHFFAPHDVELLIGSFGASAVLLFGAPRSPLSQPRNLIGGHIVSAAVGVVCWQLFHPWPGMAQAMAVATAVVLMHVTRTLHPPGGATALIATLGSAEIQRLGFWFVIVPTAVGTIILLAVALVVNNLPRTRRYPEFWW
jgi:CBS-domain-containing membrane protein